MFAAAGETGPVEELVTGRRGRGCHGGLEDWIQGSWVLVNAASGDGIDAAGLPEDGFCYA